MNMNSDIHRLALLYTIIGFIMIVYGIFTLNILPFLAGLVFIWASYMLTTDIMKLQRRIQGANH